MLRGKITAVLVKYWYLVLLALGTFEAFTSQLVVRLFGEWVAWALLTALIGASLVAILGKKRD